MIRINKGPVPAALRRASLKHNANNALNYINNMSDYDSGLKKMKFTSAYHSKSVTSALRLEQNGKCAFSEAKFVHDYHHVEHFRPKGMVVDWDSGVISYPGYYWLAYEWSNLLLCKSVINSGLKRNFFPLRGRIARNMNHLSTNSESALLIDPATEDPRMHIRFEREEIKGITARGRKNVKFFGLRNNELAEARRERFRFLKGIKYAVEALLATGSNINDPEVSEMVATLRNSVKESAEFSSMAIDFLQGWPHLV